MTERPILFSAPMVRALLAGTKTQTRRILTTMTTLGRVEYPGRRGKSGYSTVNWLDTPEGIAAAVRECRYGQPGDRLWVRETHYLHGIWSVHKDEHGKRRWSFHPNRDMGVQFSEPNGFIRGRSTTVPGWNRRPSIHMPRWASRITLEVTDVRVERLQDISEADAIAEGGKEALRGWWSHEGLDWNSPGENNRFGATAIDSYRVLWESINGPGSWEANPWVWAVSFKVVKP